MLLIRFLAILFAFAALPANGADPVLLEPEQAFAFAARALGPDAIEVRYQIAPGYYLYRDKFRFSVEPNTIELGPPELPAGKRKKDEFFGEVETYRGELRIRLPLRNAQNGAAVTVTAVSQGCADVGVCYVPQEQHARLTLAASSSTFSSPGAPNLPAGLRPSRSAAAATTIARSRGFSTAGSGCSS